MSKGVLKKKHRAYISGDMPCRRKPQVAAAAGDQIGRPYQIVGILGLGSYVENCKTYFNRKG